MSRTISGKLAGNASHGKDELLTDIYFYRPKIHPSEEYMIAVCQLENLMGTDYFEKWYDSFPKDILQADFLVFMQKEILKLTLDKKE